MFGHALEGCKNFAVSGGSIGAVRGGGGEARFRWFEGSCFLAQSSGFRL